MNTNLINAAYLTKLSTKKAEEREAMIKADAQTLVNEVLEMAEFEAKAYGFTNFGFNRSRIPHGKKGEKIVCSILRSLGFKVYRNKRNRAAMIIDWGKK